MSLGRPLFDPHDRRYPQRQHSRREVCHSRCWMVRAGAAWRMRPPDLPPWLTGYHQSQCGLKAGVWAAMAHDVWAVLRPAAGCPEELVAAIGDCRPLPSLPESGPQQTRALCGCPSAVWSSGALPGQHAFAAWCAIMHGWRRHARLAWCGVRHHGARTVRRVHSSKRITRS
jgi:transposase